MTIQDYAREFERQLKLKMELTELKAKALLAFPKAGKETKLLLLATALG